MSKYKIEKEYFKNITLHQREEILSNFQIDNNGNILISYNHKGYTVNNLQINYRSDVKAISIFSGAGGLDIGAQLAGVKVISSLDIYEDSVKTLKINPFFKDTIHEAGDITELRGSRYSQLLETEKPEKLIIIGGHPCQPFSKAGYWVTNEKRDSSNDSRNLIEPYFKIIEELKPDGFILENVESIMHSSNKATVETIYSNIDRLGYKFSVLKLNDADYVIPLLKSMV